MKNLLKPEMRPMTLSSCWQASFSASSFCVRLILGSPSAQYRLGLQRTEILRLHVQTGISSSFSEVVPSAPDDHEETWNAYFGWPVVCVIGKKPINLSSLCWSHNSLFFIIHYI